MIDSFRFGDSYRISELDPFGQFSSSLPCLSKLALLIPHGVASNILLLIVTIPIVTYSGKQRRMKSGHHNDRSYTTVLGKLGPGQLGPGQLGPG